MFPFVLDGPEAITLSGAPAGEAVERDARLLVAGEYPGKNLSVTEADIDALVTNFSGPIPVKIEHIDSPLDPLGQVVRVWREGRELRGRVSFPAAMAAFLSERGAARLSLGLLKEPAWKLLETSLTLSPHVPTATLLSDHERAELVQLRRARLDTQIGRLKAAGKVTPAAEPFARALLSADGGTVVTLSDGSSPGVGEVFLRFLGAQPPAVRLAEMAPGHRQDGASQDGASQDGLLGPAGDFTAEERAVMQRLGVDPAAVARTLAADRARKGHG